MTAVSATSITVKQAAPNAGVKIFYVKGTAAQNSDYFTVDGLTTVKGAVLRVYDGTGGLAEGTAGTITFTSNVVTVTNAGTNIFTGLVWGI